MVKNLYSKQILSYLFFIVTFTSTFSSFAKTEETSLPNFPIIYNINAHAQNSDNLSDNLIYKNDNKDETEKAFAPPVAVNDDVTINEDDIATGSVATNDSDPDGDILKFTQIGSVSEGVFVLKDDGTFTFKPNPNYNGTVVVHYRVCDPSNACADATLTITVVSINDEPTGVIDVVFSDEDMTVSGNVATNDVDPDNTPGQLTYTRIGVTEWNIIFTSNGSYTFVPRPNFSGIVAFTYKVCDPAGLCDTSSLIIIIGPINDPPVANDFTRTMPEDSTIAGNLRDNSFDVDNTYPELTYSFVDITPSAGTFTINPNGTYTFVPSPNFTGPVTVTYKVCDLDGLCDIGFITILVSPVNDPPTAVDDNISTPEDTPLTSTVAPNDIDVDNTPNQLTFTAIDSPTEGVFTMNPDGSFTFKPNPNFTGPVVITYKVCDVSGKCDTAKLTITVTPVNDPPVVVLPPLTPTEDNNIKRCVTIIDPDSGDTFTASVCGSTPNGSATTDVTGNTLCVTYTPSPNFNGADSICIRVCDASGTCVEQVVPITVTPVNDPPIITVPPTPSPVNEDTPTTICVPITDVDSGDMHTSSICGGPKNGSASISIVGGQACLTYTPKPNFNGADSVCIKVCDASGVCVENTISIDVTPTNDPPIIQVTPTSVLEDSVVTQCFRLVDNDPSDTHNVTSCGAKNGDPSVLLDLGMVCLTYRPNPNFNGRDTICVQTCDSGGSCVTTMIPITITPVNDTPSVTVTPIMVEEDKTSTRCFPITDVDTGDSHNTSLCEQPKNGTASVTVNNGEICLTYTPKPNYNGLDSVCIKVCDAAGACVNKIVLINVTSQNDPPTVIVTPIIVSEDSVITACFPISDNDLFDTHTTDICAKYNGIASAKIENGQVCVTYAPNPNFNGKDSVCVKVCDASNACIDVIVPITVTPKNDAPILVPTPITVAEDTTVTTCINIFDVDGVDIFTSEICGNPKNGNATVKIENGKACLTYIPKPNYNGKDSVCIKVCDSAGACTENNVPINVTPKNDTPSVVLKPIIVAEDSVITTCLKINDPDTGDTFSTSTCKTPTNGNATTAIDNGQVCVTYTPKPNFNGKDTVCVRVCDEAFVCVEVLVPVTVTPKNDPPTVTVTPVIVNSDYIVTQCYPIVDIDAGDKFTAISCGAGKGEATVEIKNNEVCLTYKSPNTLTSTTDTVCIIVCDSTGACVQNTVPVTISVCVDESVPTLKCPTPMEVNIVGNILSDVDKFITSSTISDDCNSNVLTFNNPVGTHPCGGVSSKQISGLLSGSLFNEGEHTMIFEAKNRTGQVATCSTTITVRPISLLTNKKIEMCANEPILVLAKNYSGGKYEWMKGNQVISNNNELFNKMATPNETGMYELNATFGNCVMKDTVQVKISPLPTAKNDSYFMAAEDTIIKNVILNDDLVTSTSKTIRLASNNNNLKGTLSFKNDGTFIYKPQNGYSGVERFDYEVCYAECPDICAKATVNIEIISQYKGTNVITPNGDGDNDTFVIEGFDYETPTGNQSEIIIYNQWGDAVYQTKSYRNDWKGDYDGKPLPSGTYYFFFKKNPNAYPVKGFVTVLR